MSNEKCKAEVWGDYRNYQCGRTAKSGGFCGIHHPDAVAKRLAKRNARWAAEEATSKARNAEINRRSKLADIAPDLIAELQDILIWATTERKPLREQEIKSIRAALAKAGL